ncbi:MAG: calcium-translocating P-type ATPase, PMCA-type [Rikenellaceae bacterium]|jgi:Ca2+-transporting ATPase|nr:calcium-translocating P-type ATPase, PMCA-type [Rikenellaceae bacterium]
METKKRLTGLTAAAVQASRIMHGDNLITPPPRDSAWKLFLEKFRDPVIRVLLIAAFLSLAISFVEWEFAETIGIFCAILLATGVAFWFEHDAQKKFDLLGRVDDDTLYKVIRDGTVQEVAKRNIVVGDVVVLETGEEIPADGRLEESLSLQVNESTLTGEPVTAKNSDPAAGDPEATYPSNMLLRGTTVVEGHGTITVTSVGNATEFGQVAREASTTIDEKTPLSKQLERLAKLIGGVGFGLSFLAFGILLAKHLIEDRATYSPAQLYFLASFVVAAGMMSARAWMPTARDTLELTGIIRGGPRPVQKTNTLALIATGAMLFAILCGVGYWGFAWSPVDRGSWISLHQANDILQAFMVAVTLMVVAVPEGLPMSVTLSLALNMRRMLKANNLVRKMHACETMGAATVICTDKTGTLTRNRMNVHDIHILGTSGNTLSDDLPGDLMREGISLNSTAFLDRTDAANPKPIGNPTEGALLLWLHRQGTDYETWRSDVAVEDQLTFTAERKFMATIVNSNVLNKRVLYIKGAPEIVFSKCAAVLGPTAEVPATDYRETIEKALLGYQSRAMRTLGFAYAALDDSVKTWSDVAASAKPVFLGIAAIADPVREDVPEAVSRCLSAGIGVKIVTGDTPGTAREIARQIGLWNDTDDTDRVHITGAEFEALTDEELLARVQALKIMSRARPGDKQRLVRLLQQRGEVVAVTGDGTNDAPALNFAQVGLSMGSGTSVAKDASDITLLDDSFNSIASAVMWGRSLYRNIQRFLVFQLTINVTALTVVLLGSLFGTELPLTVTQMLWVNLIMDTFAAAALASLPPDPRVMNDKPRQASQFIITRPMAGTIFGIGAFFVATLVGLLACFGETITPYELSAFFTFFVLLQFWNMFNAKAFGAGGSAFRELSKCKVFLGVGTLILAGQFLIVTFGGEVFRTVPLRATDWGLIFGAASVVLWVGEIARAIDRRKKKRPGRKKITPERNKIIFST